MSLNTFLTRFSLNELTPYYNDTIVPAVQSAMYKAQDIAEDVYQGLKQAEGYWEEMSIKVQNWTEVKMSPPLAKIAQAFIHALPTLLLYAISTTLAPLVISNILFTGYKIYQISREGDVAPHTYKMFFNTAGFLLAREVVKDISTAVLALDADFIAFAIYEVVLVAYAFSFSGLTQDVYNALEQPQPNHRLPPRDHVEQVQEEHIQYQPVPTIPPHDIQQDPQLNSQTVFDQ